MIILKLLKILLILPLAFVELLTLAMCWILAIPSPKTAERLMKWACRTLPNRDWYFN